MSNENLFEPIECEVVDSFVKYTKLKSFKGNGEAWLYIGRDADSMKFKTFFSNFRKDNYYYFSKDNLEKYLEDAKYEYINQSNGYRKNIFENYAIIKKIVSKLDQKPNFNDLIERQDGGRFYIRPKNLNQKHIWNIIRDLALPQISKIVIKKIRMPENYNYFFKLKFNTADIKYFDHNSNFLVKRVLEDLDKKYLKNSLIYKRLVEARIGQGYFRDQILNRMNYCIITGAKNILEASHIKPWTKSNDEEKIDCYNGIMLSPNCHKLFDKGFFCFLDNGSIKISNKISKNEFDKLVNEDKSIDKKPILNKKTLNYFKWHRNYFKNNFD